MNATLLITRRELGAYFRSLTGYIIAAIMLLVDGLLFNVLALGGPDKLSAEVVSRFFFYTSGLAVIASIFLSMRLLAEERQTGTLVLLTSSPIQDYEIVLGKFLSAFGFLALITLATIYIPAMIFVNGKISFGHLAAGYLGLLLLGSGDAGNRDVRLRAGAHAGAGRHLLGAAGRGAHHLLAAGQGDRAPVQRRVRGDGAPRQALPALQLGRGPLARRRLLPDGHVCGAVLGHPGDGGAPMALAADAVTAPARPADRRPPPGRTGPAPVGRGSGASACWPSSSASGSSALAAGARWPPSAGLVLGAGGDGRAVRPGARRGARSSRQVEQKFQAMYALGLLAVALYFVQSDVPALRGGKALEATSPKLATASCRPSGRRCGPPPCSPSSRWSWRPRRWRAPPGSSTWAASVTPSSPAWAWHSC